MKWNHLTPQTLKKRENIYKYHWDKLLTSLITAVKSLKTEASVLDSGEPDTLVWVLKPVFYLLIQYTKGYRTFVELILNSMEVYQNYFTQTILFY